MTTPIQNNVPPQYLQADTDDFSFVTGEGMVDGPFMLDDSPLPEHRPRDILSTYRTRVIDYIYDIDAVVGEVAPESEDMQQVNRMLGSDPNVDFGVPGLTTEEVDSLRVARDTDLEDYTVRLEALAARLSSDEIETQLGNKTGLPRALQIAKSSFGRATSDLLGTNADLVNDVNDLVELESDLKAAESIAGEEGRFALVMARRSNERANRSRSGIDSSRSTDPKMQEADRYLSLLNEIKDNPDDEMLRAEAETLAKRVYQKEQTYRANKAKEFTEGIIKSQEESEGQVGPELDFLYQAQNGNLDTVKAMAYEQPLNITLQAVAQSAGQSAYAAGGAVLGALIGSLGGPTGGKIGAGIGGYATTFTGTYNSMFVDELMAMGFDLSKPEKYIPALTTELIDHIDAKIRPAAEFSGAIAGGQMTVGGMVLGVGGKAIPSGAIRLPSYLSAQNLAAQTTIQAASDAGEALLTPILMGEDEFGTAGSAAQAVMANVGMAPLEPASTAVLRGAGGVTDSLTDSVNSLRARRADANEATAIENIIEELAGNETISDVAQRTAASILEGLDDPTTIEANIAEVMQEIESTGNVSSIETLMPEQDARTVDRQTTDALELQGDIFEVYPDDTTQAILDLQAQRKEAEAFILSQAESAETSSDVALTEMALEDINAEITDLEQASADATVTFSPTKQKIPYIIRDQERIAALDQETGDVDFVVRGEQLSLETTLGNFQGTDSGVRVSEKEVARVLEVVSDPEATVDQRLTALLEGYLRGAVATTVVRSDTASPAAARALLNGDNDAYIRAQGVLDSQANAFERIKAKTIAIEEGSTVSLDALVGVWRGAGNPVRDGSISKFLSMVGLLNPKSDSPKGNPGVLRRGVNKAAKVITRFTRHDGAQGSGASYIAKQTQKAKAQSATLMERTREMMSRHRGLFPTALTRAEQTAINTYTRQPTNQNAEALDAINPAWVPALNERNELKKEVSRFIQQLAPGDSRIVEIFEENMDSYWHSFYSIKDPEKALAKATPDQRAMVKNALIDRFMPDNLFLPNEDSLGKLSLSRLRQLAHVRGIPPEGKSKATLAKLLATKPPMSPKEMETMVNLFITNASRWVDTKFGEKALPSDEKIANAEGVNVRSDGGMRKDATLSKAALNDPLAYAISEVYGRVRHPDAVFQQTMIKMVDMLENYQATQSMLEIAFRIGAASTDPVSSGFDKQLKISGEHSSMMYNIPGVGNVQPQSVWMSREVGEMFEAVFSPQIRDKEGAPFLRGVVALNDFLKYMYTVGNIPAHLRNTASGVMIINRNGTLYELGTERGRKAIADAIGVAINDTTSSDATGTAGAYNELKLLATDYNILHDSVKGGVLEDLRKDFTVFLQRSSSVGFVDVAQSLNDLYLKMTNRLEQEVGKDIGSIVVRKAADGFTKAGEAGTVLFEKLEDSYRFTDEIPKLITFFMNRHYYAKIFTVGEGKAAFTIPMDKLVEIGIGTTARAEHLESIGFVPTQRNIDTLQRQLDFLNRASAVETIQTTPTYSMVGPYMRALRAMPLIGPFPAFTSEVFRNQANAWQLANSSIAAAFSGKVTLDLDGEQHVLRVPRSILATRAMAKVTGIVTDMGKMHGAKLLGASAILAGEGGEDDAEFEAIFRQLAKAPVDGHFPEDVDPDVTVAGDFSSLGAALAGPFVHEYGLIPIGYNSEKQTMRFVDMEFTDMNAPVWATAQEGISAFNRWRNREDYPDFSITRAGLGILDTSIGAMMGAEPGAQLLAEAFVNYGKGDVGTDYQDFGSSLAAATRKALLGAAPSYIKSIAADVARGEFLDAAVRLGGVKVYEIDVPERMGNMAVGVRADMRVHRRTFMDQMARVVSPASIGDDPVDLEQVRDSYIKWRQSDAKAMIRLRRAGMQAIELLTDVDRNDVTTWISWREGSKSSIGFSIADASMLMRGAKGQIEDGAPLPFENFSHKSFDRLRNDFVAGTGSSGTRRKLNPNQVEQANANLREITNYIYSLDNELLKAGTVEGLPLFQYQ